MFVCVCGCLCACGRVQVQPYTCVYCVNVNPTPSLSVLLFIPPSIFVCYTPHLQIRARVSLCLRVCCGDSSNNPPHYTHNILPRISDGPPDAANGDRRREKKWERWMKKDCFNKQATLYFSFIYSSKYGVFYQMKTETEPLEFHPVGL